MNSTSSNLDPKEVDMKTGVT